jgi:hypothetical protein
MTRKEQGAKVTARRRICVVAHECAGLNGRSADGVATRGLAVHLASLGYQVDLIITDLDADVVGQAGDPFSVLALRAIVAADHAIDMPINAPMTALAVYRHIRASTYEAVHFSARGACGYFVGLAREQGIISSRIVTHVHGLSVWTRQDDLANPSLADLETEAMEHRQIEMSDVVVAFDQWSLDRLSASVPRAERTLMLEPLLPQWFDLARDSLDTQTETRGVPPSGIREIVIFGPLQRAAGLPIILDAVLRLTLREEMPMLTFVGPFDRLDGEHSAGHVLRRLGAYPAPVRFINNMPHDEVLRYLAARSDRLCLLYSASENAATTTALLQDAGLPNLLWDKAIDGGAAEAAAPSTLAKALAVRLDRALVEGLASVQSVSKPTTIIAAWAELHTSLGRTRPRDMQRSIRQPLVSVCLVHYERPDLLTRALSALALQDYGNVEVVIVDDGSTSDAACDALRRIECNPIGPFPVKVIRTKNRYLGAARNTAATHAAGEYLLFHDDDNVAEPNEISSFVNAALATGADILTCQAFLLENDDFGKRRMFGYPTGLGGSFSFVHNRFGDANALVKASAFRALGGFTERIGVGWEDWEFFLRAWLRGFKLSVVPEPLFWYRVSSGGMLSAVNPRLSREQLFSLVEREKPQLKDDMLRLLMVREMRVEERTFAQGRLAISPDAALHLDLMRMSPNSDEARVTLVEVALGLGRLADAEALATGHPQALARLRELGCLNASSPIARREISPITFAQPVRSLVKLTGWWVDDKGPLPLPDTILISGERHRVIASARTERPDVAAAHQFSQSSGVGFVLLAEPVAENLGLRLFDRIRNRWLPLGVDRDVLGRCTVAFPATRNLIAHGHVDEVAACCIANTIELEKPKTVELISDGRANAVLLRDRVLQLPDRADLNLRPCFSADAGSAVLVVERRIKSGSVVVY